MDIFFCEQWSRGYREARKTMSAKQAEQCHEHGKLYTVLLGNINHPSCFLEFSAFRSVAVEFLDQALRTYRCYSFQEKAPNQLFLSMVRAPEFPNDVDDPVRATVFYFKTTGHVAIVRYEGHADGVGSRIASREERQVDVTNNWERFPEFGHYEGLTKMNRGIPLLDLNV